MIGKGCTCINTFTTPFAEGDIKAIRITYCQNGVIVFEKQLSDCHFSDNGSITVYLTQEDTLKLDHSKVVRIQLKIKFGDESVVKSKIIETITDELLNCEVI